MTDHTCSMKQAFFITGSDTVVGKTLASAVITSVLQATYWKPIESGTELEISDTQTVQYFNGLSDKYFIPSLFSFKARLSPDQAAKLENKTIDLSQCILPQSKDLLNNTLIVEGAGGVYVPLNEKKCMLDLIEQFHLPIIIVTRGTLGTINHTLLTIKAIQDRNLPIKGIIFSGDLHQENQIAIEKWGNVKTLFHIPFFPQLIPKHFQEWVHQNMFLISKALA